MEIATVHQTLALHVLRTFNWPVHQLVLLLIMERLRAHDSRELKLERSGIKRKIREKGRGREIHIQYD